MHVCVEGKVLIHTHGGVGLWYNIMIWLIGIEVGLWGCVQEESGTAILGGEGPIRFHPVLKDPLH